MLIQYRNTYQAEADCFASYHASIFCTVLAYLIHPDLNNRPFFDILWSNSLYIDVLSTLPQLWMIGKLGGKIDALSAHYVALIAFSRAIDMIFWYYGFEELAPENETRYALLGDILPESTQFNLAGWTVLSAHAIHLLLMWDFMYCYIQCFLAGRLLHKEFDFTEMLIDV